MSTPAESTEKSSPSKLKAGFNFGGSGGTQFTAGGSIGAKRTDGLLVNYDGSGKVGASAHGGLHGGGYAGYKDKMVGTNAEINGKVGGELKDNFAGEVGVDKELKGHLGLTNRIITDGEFGAGGGANLAYNKDAEDYEKLYGDKSNVKNMLEDKY